MGWGYVAILFVGSLLQAGQVYGGHTDRIFLCADSVFAHSCQVPNHRMVVTPGLVWGINAESSTASKPEHHGTCKTDKDKCREYNDTEDKFLSRILMCCRGQHNCSVQTPPGHYIESCGEKADWAMVQVKCLPVTSYPGPGMTNEKCLSPYYPPTPLPTKPNFQQQTVNTTKSASDANGAAIPQQQVATKSPSDSQSAGQAVTTKATNGVTNVEVNGAVVTIKTQQNAAIAGQAQTTKQPNAGQAGAATTKAHHSLSDILSTNKPADKAPTTISALDIAQKVTQKDAAVPANQQPVNQGPSADSGDGTTKDVEQQVGGHQSSESLVQTTQAGSNTNKSVIQQQVAGQATANQTPATQSSSDASGDSGDGPTKDVDQQVGGHQSSESLVQTTQAGSNTNKSVSQQQVAGQATANQTPATQSSYGASGDANKQQGSNQGTGSEGGSGQATVNGAPVTQSSSDTSGEGTKPQGSNPGTGLEGGVAGQTPGKQTSSDASDEQTQEQGSNQGAGSEGGTGHQAGDSSGENNAADNDADTESTTSSGVESAVTAAGLQQTQQTNTVSPGEPEPEPEPEEDHSSRPEQTTEKADDDVTTIPVSVQLPDQPLSHVEDDDSLKVLELIGIGIAALVALGIILLVIGWVCGRTCCSDESRRRRRSHYGETPGVERMRGEVGDPLAASGNSFAVIKNYSEIKHDGVSPNVSDITPVNFENFNPKVYDDVHPAPVVAELNMDVQEVSFPVTERTPTINTPEVPKSQAISRLKTPSTDGTYDAEDGDNQSANDIDGSADGTDGSAVAMEACSSSEEEKEHTLYV